LVEASWDKKNFIFPLLKIVCKMLGGIDLAFDMEAKATAH